MDVTGLSLTTITLFLPMIGLAILLLMNGETQKANLKWVAFATSVVTFVASVLMWINFDPASAELQMVQRNTWAEISLGERVINVSYFVGRRWHQHAAGLADDLHHAHLDIGFLR